MAGETERCQYCGRGYSKRGIRSHEQFCSLNPKNIEEGATTVHPGTPEEPINKMIDRAVRDRLEELGIVDEIDQDGLTEEELTGIKSEVHDLLNDLKGEIKDLRDAVISSQTAVKELAKWTESRLTSMEEAVADLAESEEEVEVDDEVKEDEKLVLDVEEKKEIAEILRNGLAPLQREMDRRDRELARYQTERDEQMGAHLNDLKMRVDAQNARVAQYGHRIEALRADLIEAQRPRDAASPEPEKAQPEESPQAEETIFIGRCTSKKEIHFFEPGEEHLNKCPVDGTKILKYPEPRRLKTKA